MNRIAIDGRLAHDPEIRTTNNGTEFCAFRIAFNAKVGARAEFFDIEAWEDRTKPLKTASKGDSVSIHGRLKQNSWQDPKTGESRSKTVVAVWDLMIIPRPKPINTRIEQSEYEAMKKPDDTAIPF